MAGGWAKDGAVQDQIDASVEDAVKKPFGIPMTFAYKVGFTAHQ